MNFAEDLPIYFDDFGKNATSNGLTGKVIFDQPDEISAGGEIIATDYTITFITKDFPDIATADTILIESDDCALKEEYKVRTIRKLDDGLTSSATLSKV